MMKHLVPANILKECEFRYARTEDVDALLILYQQFFDEASYARFIALDLPKAKKNLVANFSWRIIDQQRPHIVALVDQRIVGFVSWEFNDLFTTRPVATMHELYVVPERRLSAIGRYLTALMEWACRDKGVCLLQAGALNATSRTTSLKNMFFKLGFVEDGFIVRKELE